MYSQKQLSDNFEKLCQYTKSKHAITISTGTSALHISYLCQGVKANDEILMPSINFIAAANAALIARYTIFHRCRKKFSFNDLSKLEDYLKKIPLLKICVNKKTGRTIRALVFTPIWISWKYNKNKKDCVKV